MLTAEGCEARRKRLWAELDPKPDWVIVADPSQLVYFANYFVTPFLFRGVESTAVLLLGKGGEAILVADNLAHMFAQHACVTERVEPIWYQGKKSAPHRGLNLVNAAIERLGRCPGTHFGIESAHTPGGILEGLRSSRASVRFSSIDEVVRKLRRSKLADEVALMRRSIRAGDVGHAAAMRDIQPGMTELEAYLAVQHASILEAGDPSIVYGDFVSGPRCEDGGGPPSLRRIEAGDLVLLDFSVVIHSYRGDFANTFVCGGEPSERQMEMHRACLAAMEAGEELIRPGAQARALDEAVRATLKELKLEEYFHSHSGHGLGLGHPEPPYIVPDSTDTLVEGDIITLEPGLFIKGVGGMRFERNYLVTATGFETLSHLDLTLVPPRVQPAG